MKTGKIQESVLKRSILKKIKTKRPEVIVSAAPGIDVGGIALGKDEVFVISTDSFVDGNEDALAISIHSAVNNIATSGAEPVAITFGAFLPETMEEASLKEMMDQVEALCATLNIQAIGGHTQITDAVIRPVISVTAVGKVKKENLITTKGAKPGQDIVLTKWIGLSGTSILAKEKESIIAEKYKQDLINAAKNFDEFMSVRSEAATAVKSGVSAMHDLSQGGVMNALWDLSVAAGVGLTIDLKSIPVRQETIEICEIFDVNPYRLISTGSLLIVCDNGLAMVDALAEEGINAQVIGKTTDSNDKIILNDGEVTYLDAPKPDELLIQK